MTVTGKNIINIVEDIAPPILQEEWDNSGLQIGDINKEVGGVLMVMDVSDKSVDYAIDNNIDMIISHHPFLFTDLKSIDFSSYKGHLIEKIIKNDLLIYSAHTNLDRADLGVNKVLGEKIGLENIEFFSDYFEDEIGVFGDSNLSFEGLIEKIKSLGDKNPIVYGEAPKSFKKVGVIGGTGSFGIDLAKKLNLDILLTSDVKHHDGQKAYEEGICLINIGHFYSEFPVLFRLKEIIKKEYEDLRILIFDNPVFFYED